MLMCKSGFWYHGKSSILLNIFLTYSLQNMISTSHCFWTHSVTVPCVVSCLSYPLGRNIIHKLIIYEPIYFDWNNTRKFMLVFINKNGSFSSWQTYLEYNISSKDICGYLSSSLVTHVINITTFLKVI